MRKIVMLSLAFMIAFLLAGNAEAGSTIDTTNITLMAYYNPGTNITLSEVIKEFDFVTESTGQYVEGKLRMWYDSPNGNNPGNIRNFERRNDADTNILFASNVSLRVRSDGWIVAWLTNEQNLSDIVFWNDANTHTIPSETTLGKAVWRVTNRVGANYNKSQVKYYSYKYPEADSLLIGGRNTYNTFGTYKFFIPSTNTVYDAKLLWTSYLYDITDSGSYTYDAYGKIWINTSNYYDKNTSTSPYYYYGGVYEYARYYQDIITLPRDSSTSIFMESGYRGYSGNIGFLKSAVAILYKSG